MTDEPPKVVYVVCTNNHAEGFARPFIVFAVRRDAEDFVRRADVYGMVTREIVEAEDAR